MAACNRKWLWNNVYLSLYTPKQQNSNGYTYVFDVKQLDWTDRNTAVCRGELEIKEIKAWNQKQICHNVYAR